MLNNLLYTFLLFSESQILNRKHKEKYYPREITILELYHRVLYFQKFRLHTKISWQVSLLWRTEESGRNVGGTLFVLWSSNSRHWTLRIKKPWGCYTEHVNYEFLKVGTTLCFYAVIYTQFLAHAKGPIYINKQISVPTNVLHFRYLESDSTSLCCFRFCLFLFVWAFKCV